MRRRDADLLEAVDHGDRLDELRQRVTDAAAGGTTTVEQYAIDDVHVTLVVPFGEQSGLSLGLESRVTVTTETYYDDENLISVFVGAVRDVIRHGPPDGRSLDERRGPALGGVMSDPLRFGVLGSRRSPCAR